ncbi:hypothetical protein B0H13DRAFT_2659745 [Mycena leptocephala]|nr:hypothetical protein B0H13DRAFT_2659745 [Mycena leptocephala]
MLFRAVPHLHVLRTLQCLCRLTIDVNALLEDPRMDVLHPMFCNITHLELIYFDIASENAPQLCARLSCIPLLTHIALNSPSHVATLHTGLRTNMQLDARLHKRDPLSDDNRFVCMKQTKDFRSDWLCGADTGENYWALADRFIAVRLAGKCDRSHYMISDTDNW